MTPMAPERLEELLSLLEASVRRPLVRWPRRAGRVATREEVGPPVALLVPSDHVTNL